LQRIVYVTLPCHSNFFYCIGMLL